MSTPLPPSYSQISEEKGGCCNKTETASLNVNSCRSAYPNWGCRRNGGQQQSGCNCCADVPNHPIFLFDSNEFVKENQPSCAKKLLFAANKVYRCGFYFMFYLSIFLSFLALPFVGCFAGGFEAVLSMFFRPFARPVGKIISETLGYAPSSYFQYRNNNELVLPTTIPTPVAIPKEYV